MFKVGDLIIGNERSNNRYMITNQRRGFVGKILKVKENCSFFDDDIEIEAIFLDKQKTSGRKFWVNSSFFTLAKDNKITINRMRGRR